MRLVNVIPLTRGPGRETLTYFTAKDIPVGALVTVPMRSKAVPALVISSSEATDAKTTLKRADFEMKKVIAVTAPTFFLPEFIAAASTTARYFATSTGAVLDSLTPKAILEDPEVKVSAAQAKRKRRTVPGPREPLIFQSSDEDRFTTYKSLIREEFAKHSSVFFCLPTIQDIEKTITSLERGIKEYTYILHSDMPRKKIKEMWTAILSEEHPVLIIATGMFLSIPRTDIHTIIIEEESNYAYKLAHRPAIDIRTFAEFFAKELGAKLILGDLFLRTETLFRKDLGHVTEFIPLKFRALSNAVSHVINMKEPKDSIIKKGFTMFSDQLLEMLAIAHDRSESSFLLAARRGLYPITVCNDCGTIVMCSRCAAPLVLHQTPGYARSIDTDNMFVCHRCSETRAADDLCKKCDGWRFSLLGIGSEHVEHELRRKLPNALIFRLDKDTAPTRRKALEIRDKFYSSPGSVLTGTSMALGYLDRKIDRTAVISIDSLFTIPDFHINERIFNLLLRMRDLAIKDFIIQTRVADHLIFEYATRGSLVDFYRSEIEERRQFKYPPFKLLIKISYEDTERQALEKMSKVKEFLKEYSPVIFPAFTAKSKGKHVLNAIIKVDTASWPDNTLLQKLYTLPPAFTISVDPDTIL